MRDTAQLVDDLKRYIRDNQITQKEFCKKANMGHATLWKIMKEDYVLTKRMSRRVYKSICEVLYGEVVEKEPQELPKYEPNYERENLSDYEDVIDAVENGDTVQNAVTGVSYKKVDGAVCSFKNDRCVAMYAQILNEGSFFIKKPIPIKIENTGVYLTRNGSRAYVHFLDEDNSLAQYTVNGISKVFQCNTSNGLGEDSALDLVMFVGG